MLQTFWKELQQRNGYDKVAVTHSGCRGPCDQGTNALVYPEGIVYNGVTKDNVAEILDKHLIGGEPIARLRAADAVWS